MSGGTTGTPKGVVGTHGAYVIAGLQIKTWNAAALTGSDDVLFLPLPLFHVYANVGVQALALLNGCAIALAPNPRDLPDLVADPLCDERRLRVIQDNAFLLIEPAGSLVNLSDDRVQCLA